MENNIFIKKKIQQNPKYNPDIVINYNTTINKRTTNIDRTNEPFKLITDLPVKNIKSAKDLIIDTTETNNVNIMLSKINSDRSQLDNELNMKYTEKVKEENYNAFSNKLLQFKMMSYKTDDYENLKTTRDDYYKNLTDQLKQNEDLYNNILNDLNK
jgi:hypothetical protein